MPRLLGRLNSAHSTVDQARTPAEEATWVTISAWAAEKSAAPAEPALKPNQPTHRKAAPMCVRTRECGALGMRG